MTTANDYTTTVVAPAYNEADVIETFVRTVLAELPADWALLVVDDGSTDDTHQILDRLEAELNRLTVHSHQENAGMGAALITGFGLASSDVVVTMDADLTHPLDLAPALAAACRANAAAFGSRYVPGGGMVGVPAWRVLISRLANVAMRLVYLSPVRDITTGFRAYQRLAVQDLDLAGRGFETQMEITIRLLSRGYQIAELPMILTNREVGESKMQYLKLIPSYGRMALSMLRIRWIG